MVDAMPVDLSGTLTVNPKAKQVAYDSMGGMAISMPIRGTLHDVGSVRGYWVQTQDPSGNLNGPDELHLQNPKGKVTISFQNPLASRSSTKALPQGAVTSGQSAASITAAQRVTGGAKAYAHATESGTVSLTVASTGRSIKNLVLVTGAGIHGS